MHYCAELLPDKGHDKLGAAGHARGKEQVRRRRVRGRAQQLEDARRGARCAGGRLQRVRAQLGIVDGGVRRGGLERGGGGGTRGVALGVARFLFDGAGLAQGAALASGLGVKVGARQHLAALGADVLVLAGAEIALVVAGAGLRGGVQKEGERRSG